MTDNCKRVHFIGVGGVGMSGIARVAADAGMRVSGSDMKSSRYTDDLLPPAFLFSSATMPSM